MYQTDLACHSILQLSPVVSLERLLLLVSTMIVGSSMRSSHFQASTAASSSPNSLVRTFVVVILTSHGDHFLFVSVRFLSCQFPGYV